jgi:hypothetical protein
MKLVWQSSYASIGINITRPHGVDKFRFPSAGAGGI